MLPNSAYTLVPIVQGVDYTPTPQTIALTDPNTGHNTQSPPLMVSNGVTAPVFALFCTTTSTGTTSVQALGNASPVNFPSGSFIQGVVYYIYLAKITALGGATFVGYQYIAQPLVY